VNVLNVAALVAFSLAIPVIVLRLSRRYTIIRKLSPVVVCYLIGMIPGNMPGVTIDAKLALTVSGVAVAMAIPLLLFSVNFVAWFRLAGPTLLAFTFACIAPAVAATIGHFLFRDHLAETAKMAGMLVGVYIGGTGNMNAVGMVVGAKPSTFMTLNTADMLNSLLYLTFLLTLAGPLYSRFMRPYPYPEGAGPTADASWDPYRAELPPWRKLVPSILLALAIVAVCGGLSGYLPANSRDAITILAVTTLAVGASFLPAVQKWPGTEKMGQFLMLVFFVCIGLISDLRQLVTASPMVFLFDIFVLSSTVLIQLILCWACRIDRDTTIITSVAAVFSPPFIGPVALALRNREILVPGIICGLVGYALANYAGAALAWALG